MDWDNPMVGIKWVTNSYRSFQGCQFNFVFKNGDVSNAKMPGDPSDWKEVIIPPEDSLEFGEVTKLVVYLDDKDERSDEAGQEADWIVAGF